GTPLSNFEATQNYVDVQDPAVTVLFKLADRDAYLAAWTTTPWTLPSNLAVCVGPDIDYVLARDAERGVDLYMAEARLSEYGELEVKGTLKGRDLLGLAYEPLFPYFADQVDKGAFVVVMDDYVTTDSGTGLVHQAPAFGEDDYRVLKAAGITAFANPVTLEGRFTDEVSDFAGQYVKDADKEIIQHLKGTGALYVQDVIQHAYPYCYRSDTPLIYRAIPSWYVRVTDLRDRLLANNDQIHWVPDHIQHGRFGKWLEGSIDWAVSRNRVWGTPLPIWINDTTGNAVCLGSIAELAERSGVTVDDLHREHVDPLTFTVDGEEGTYRRIEEVLDCWFESGSMPYAQLHYPFENEDVFEAGFPAEFIAEGLDQTRGWFYTLTVLAAALYDKPAFQNCIVNGMVMAEDGKKMSKRLRNYTPPDDLMEEFGADSLRLYLINSGLMKGEEQRFTDSGVRDMIRRVLLPWFNASSFLETYARIDGWSPATGKRFGENVLDRWILSRLQTLKANVAREMEEYRLYNVVPQLFSFIEDLTNWYIRLNRSRFWGEEMTDDRVAAYSTLYTTLEELSLLMAPFTPFLSEHLYRQLAALSGTLDEETSVHLQRYPTADDSLVETELERAVDRMQQVILLGRQKREEVKINLRTPLSCLTIVHRDPELLEEMRQLEGYVQAELNVQRVQYSSDEAAYIEVVAKPNFKLLGRRLGKRMKEFQQAIQALDGAAIAQLQGEGSIEVLGELFTSVEIQVHQSSSPGKETVSNGEIAASLDCQLTPELVRGGYAREVVNRIQRQRKESGLHVADRIEVTWRADGELQAALEEHAEYVAGEVLAVRFEAGAPSEPWEAEIDGHKLAFHFEVAANSANRDSVS
ncbi:MAG: isoleucine--tRNA ligase, partial [Acidobacteriota bacterium]